MKAIIILGHSHLSSIVKALVPRVSQETNTDADVQYFVFDTVRLGPDFQFSVPDAPGSANYILNPDIFRMIADKVPPQADLIFVSMFGGNAHNALTLLEHPRPFDVILPERPQMRVPGAELAPYGYIESVIKRLAQGYILNMMTLRAATQQPVFHFESPPPCGDNNYVLQHLEGYFKSQTSTPVIAPRELRYKLWRMHSKIIESACRPNNIGFMKAPPNTQDPEGFLVPEAYGDDSTHAGAWYGEQSLIDFERLNGLHYAGWQWLF